MVVTVVDAEVAPERAADVLAAWAGVSGGPLPPGLVESFLMRAGDAWRIATVWESREVLEEMRRTTETPGAFLVFLAAGAEPKLTVFEVAGHLVRPAG